MLMCERIVADNGLPEIVARLCSERLSCLALMCRELQREYGQGNPFPLSDEQIRRFASIRREKIGLSMERLVRSKVIERVSLPDEGKPPTYRWLLAL